MNVPFELHIALPLSARQAEAGVHLRHLVHLDARRHGRRHGARHRAGAHDRPAAGGPRPDPRRRTRTSSSGSAAASPTTTPRPTRLRQVPHVLGAAPAILGQALVIGRGEQRVRFRSRASTRRSSRGHRHRAARCAAAASTRWRRRSDERRRHPARQATWRPSSASSVGDSVTVADAAGHAVADGHDPARRGGCTSPARSAWALRVRLARTASCRSTSRSACSARTDVDLIQLRVDDIYAAPRDCRVASDDSSGPTTSTQDWADMNQSLFSALCAREDRHLARPSA